MKTVKVKSVIIGEGIPKICVPIFERTEEDILSEAENIATLAPDIAELRADRFEHYGDPDKLTNVLAKLRGILGEMPILFTIRTSAEGGDADVSDDDYAKLITRACESGYIDLVDVESLRGQDVGEIIKVAHSFGVKALASHHDFEKTPKKEEIVSSFLEMQRTDADILKIAVMPQGIGDVKILMEAAEEVVNEYADRPVVAISMSDKGTVSRIAAEAFGSAMTFGAASKASAPGQIGVEELRESLEDFHETLESE